jgi:hypothetical protein
VVFLSGLVAVKPREGSLVEVVKVDPGGSLDRLHLKMRTHHSQTVPNASPGRSRRRLP